MKPFLTRACTLLGLLLLSSALGFSGKASGQSITQMAKLISSGASGRMADDSFGYSVAISGNYAVVGAPYQDTDDTGGNSMTDAGAVYLFYGGGSTWTFQQKLVAPDRQVGDHFGYSVSISGNYVIVGAPLQDYDSAGGGMAVNDAGAAYTYSLVNGVWTAWHKLVDKDRQTGDHFGTSVAMPASYFYGKYAVVGAPYQDYDTAGSGTPMIDAGAAYVFYLNANGWRQLKIVAADRQPNDHFGASVAVTADYNTSICPEALVVGAPYQDYDSSGGGAAVSDAGAAYVFGVGIDSYMAYIKMVAPDRQANDHFGASVAASNYDIIVGAPNQDYDTGRSSLVVNDAGAAYLFDVPLRKIVAADRQTNDHFGASVANFGAYSIVGAPGQDYDAIGSGTFVSNAGAAYVFTNWYQGRKLVAADRQTNDYFGHSVAIHSMRWTGSVLAGAPGQDCDTTGINSVTEAGAAYVFEGTSLSVSPTTAHSGGISLAPQPVREHFTITNSNASLEGTVAQVLDIQGREIGRFVVKNGVSVDASNWTPGMYILHLADGSALRVVKE